MLTITDFARFERRDTLRVRGALPWLALPVDLTSAGLVKLRLKPNGCRAFGVFVLLLEYAASRFVGERDGKVKDDLETLAAILMVPLADLREDVKALESIGWVETDGEHAADMPQECRRSAAEVPQTCGVDRIGLDRIGQDRTPLPPSGAAVEKPKQKPPKVDPDLVAKVIQEWNAIRKRWSLDHWPVARTPRSLSSLAARITECGGPDPFLEAFKDRLERAAVGYRKPPESGWAPDLAWILKPNGWDKAGAYQRPKPVLEPVTHDMPEGIDFWNPEKSGLRR